MDQEQQPDLMSPQITPQITELTQNSDIPNGQKQFNPKHKNILIILLLSGLMLAVVFIFILPSIQSAPYRNYLNKKYGFGFFDLSLTSYKKPFKGSAGIFGSGGSPARPATAHFKDKNGKDIQVVNVDGVYSDSYQIRKISDMASTYFSNLIKYKVEFVKFKSAYNGGPYDPTLSNFIQSGNNYLVNNHNIEKFLIDFGNWSGDSSMLPNEGTITLYVRIDKSDNITAIMNNIDSKIINFVDNTKLDEFSIWLYSGNKKLSIVNAKDDTLAYQGEFENYYVSNLSNIESYMFYVNPNGNNRDPNFTKNGNFYIDDRKMWFENR